MDDSLPNSEIVSLTPDELSESLLGFQIDKLVSRSATGTIYRGVQTSLERDIMVKVLPIITSSNLEMRNAFENDAKTMARLNHQNLVGVYDFGEIHNTLYMVTEYVRGHSLYEITHDKHVGEEEAAQLVLDICKGLDCAHSAGIVHQGLTPSNILVNEEAEAKIVDFGISSIINHELTDDLASYCAPEIMADNGDVDSRADIYSAGIILYELIVGYLPSNPYTAPSLLRASDEILDNIILRAIQPNAADRYSTAGEMAAELKTFLNSLSEPVVATQQTSTRLTAAPRTTAKPLPINKLSDVKSNNNLTTLITLLIMVAICFAAYRYYISLSLPETESKPKTEYIFRGSE